MKFDSATYAVEAAVHGEGVLLGRSALVSADMAAGPARLPLRHQDEIPLERLRRLSVPRLAAEKGQAVSRLAVRRDESFRPGRGVISLRRPAIDSQSDDARDDRFDSEACLLQQSRQQPQNGRTRGLVTSDAATRRLHHPSGATGERLGKTCCMSVDPIRRRRRRRRRRRDKYARSAEIARKCNCLYGCCVACQGSAPGARGVVRRRWASQTACHRRF